MAHLNLYK